MGRFAYLVDSPVGMKGFRARYHIPQGVFLWYCALGKWLTHREEREVVIPMIVFIEGGMMLSMGKVTRDYLIARWLCLHQCMPNLFRVLGSVDTLIEQMGLNLTWHDVV